MRTKRAIKRMVRAVEGIADALGQQAYAARRGQSFAEASKYVELLRPAIEACVDALLGYLRGPSASTSAPFGPFPVRPNRAPRTECEVIGEGDPNLAPGWVCHVCCAYNGQQRPVCKACGHAPCGDASRQAGDPADAPVGSA
jgi:hypothetical protein